MRWWDLGRPKPGGAAPDADPTLLTASFVSGSQIDLAWTANATNASGYKIERKTGAGSFVEIAAVPTPNLAAYSDNSVVEDAVFTYRVRAYRGSKNSGYSNEDSAETLPAAPANLDAVLVSSASAPAAPSGLTVTFNAQDDIQLDWTDNSNNEDGFRIERKDDVGVFIEIAAVGIDEETYTDELVALDTIATYRVKAFNDIGESSYSNEDSTETLPNPPEDLTATTVDHESIDLDWTGDDIDLEDNFEVERKTGAGAFAQIATPAAGSTSYSDTGLTPSTTYVYRVRASNALGNSDYSGEASATTTAAPAVPNRPTNFVPVFVSNSRIDMTWTDASSDETGFKIERSDNGGVFAEIATPAANDTSYSDTTVSEDNAYTYRMRAVNGVGNSAYTPTADVWTLPAAPTSLTATTVSDTQIQLAWTDNSSIETDYMVQRKIGAGAYSALVTLGPNSQGYLDTGLTPNTLYTYRVRCSRGTAATNSPFSNEDSDTTASGENLVVFSGDYPTGFAVESDEIGVISGTVTSAANVEVHGTLRMRPGATLRFTGIDNSTWSFDAPHVSGIDASDVGLWIHGNGKLDAIGTEKTPWLRAAGSISAGTTITLESAPTGWLAGDEVAVAPTNEGDYEPEVRVIQSVFDVTVTLTAALSKTHPSVDTGDGVYTAEVLNLTRDVRIEGTGPTQMSHVLFMDHDPPLGGVAQTIKYVQIRYCGMHKPLTQEAPDASGRYGLHFHMMNDGTQGSLIEGVVVRDGLAHAFVPHQSNGITYQDCIAYSTAWSQFWWDPFDPSETPYMESRTIFSEANDIVYDHCVGARMIFPAGVPGYHVGVWMLGRGTNMTRRDCVSFAGGGSKEASGMHWPSQANPDPNVWLIMTGNVDHNNRRGGARSWQNDKNLHPIDDYTVYNCGDFGVAQGAYGNHGYRWSNFRFVGNGNVNTKGIIHHTAAHIGHPDTPPARADGYTHSWEFGVIKNFDIGSYIPLHNGLANIPTLVKDVDYQDIGTAVIRVDEGTDPTDNPGLYDFVDCTRDGVALQESDIDFIAALEGFLLRVQNGATAFEIDHTGVATSIAPFYTGS